MTSVFDELVVFGELDGLDEHAASPAASRPAAATVKSLLCLRCLLVIFRLPVVEVSGTPR
ncbi:MAG: hypothetical protein ACRDOK_07240 [Streptosporangiaceae bacterium]